MVNRHSTDRHRQNFPLSGTKPKLSSKKMITNPHHQVNPFKKQQLHLLVKNRESETRNIHFCQWDQASLVIADSNLKKFNSRGILRPSFLGRFLLLGQGMRHTVQRPPSSFWKKMGNQPAEESGSTVHPAVSKWSTEECVFAISPLECSRESNQRGQSVQCRLFSICKPALQMTFTDTEMW